MIKNDFNNFFLIVVFRSSFRFPRRDPLSPGTSTYWKVTWRSRCFAVGVMPAWRRRHMSTTWAVLPAELARCSTLTDIGRSVLIWALLSHRWSAEMVTVSRWANAGYRDMTVSRCEFVELFCWKILLACRDGGCIQVSYCWFAATVTVSKCLFVESQLVASIGDSLDPQLTGCHDNNI